MCPTHAGRTRHSPTLEGSENGSRKPSTTRWRFCGRVDVSIAVTSGRPVSQILSYTEENEAAFIVIATHGRTGLERMLTGSVAEKVTRRASCPVCTVKFFGQSFVEKEKPESKGAPQ